MAPPEVNDRDVPREEVVHDVDDSSMYSTDWEGMARFLNKTQPSIEDKANDQLAAQPKDNFGFKKAANGFLPGRPSPPCPINLHQQPKDVRHYHKHLLSDHERDADVIRCVESPFTYVISKDRVDVQSNIPPSSEISVLSSSGLSLEIDQSKSRVGVTAIIYGNRIQKSVQESWKVPSVTSFSFERHMKELFEIQSKSTKLVFGGRGYKGNPFPPPATAKARGWIAAVSKGIQMKYDNSLLNSDQRSNRNRKKVGKGASFSSSLEEGGTLLGKHHSAHHSASSKDPPGSSQSPPSSSSKSEENGDSRSSPRTQRRKRGRASTQRGDTFSRESPTGEENSDGLPCGDPSKSAQAVEKEGAHVPFEQKLHLSEEPLSFASTKVPPDKAATEKVSQAPSYGSPRAEVQSQVLPALLCSETAGQPKVKLRQTTATAEGIGKDPPVAIQDDATNQPWSLFNVKPPPHSQASHGVEISVPAEVKWKESATISSSSVAIQLREHGLTSKNSESFQENLSPGNELLQTKVATGEINKDIFNEEPTRIEKSPSCAPEVQAGGLDSPALPSTNASPMWPPVGQHVLNDHSLFGPLKDESSAEFSPIPFSSLAGDDGFIPKQLSSQLVCKQEVVASNHGEIYQLPIEEAGQPGNTHMVVSLRKPMPPADWMQVNQPNAQAAASEPLCLLPYTTGGGRIVGPFSDFWGFTAFVELEQNDGESERE